MAVSFDELSGSPQYTIGEGKYTATRMGVIAWTDIPDFIAEVFPVGFGAGTSNVQTIGVGFPGNSTLRAVNLRIDPMFGESDTVESTDSLTELPVYALAKATITYRVPEYGPGDPADPGSPGFSLDPVQYLVHSGAVGGRYLKLDGTGYKWDVDDDPAPSDLPNGKWERVGTHTVKWPNVNNPPWNALETLAGYVNASSFYLRNYPYPAETLLYEGYDFERSFNSDGSGSFSITMKFSVKQVPSEEAGETIGGHNHFYREFDTLADAGGYYRLEKRDGTKIFPTADFNQLFGLT